MTRSASIGWCIACSMLWALDVSAQISVNIAGYTVKAGRQEKIGDQHWLLTDTVELQRGDTQLYADEVEYFESEGRVLARGNVAYSQGTNRIASDRADFKTKTGLGTFYHAHGIATVKAPQQAPPRGGIVVPQATGAPPDVYFFGETVEKVESKKYKITNGGFSTCVQPTARWELSAETMTLNVDRYTLLYQAILRVKGVPMMYLPIMYYPTQEDGRATGFLLPTYGASTIRGQTIHNAFFWAIGRSHDATVLYDYFSKTGTGTGAEYRFNLGNGGDGNLAAYFLNQRAASYDVGGRTTLVPAERSNTINGYANRQLPGGLQARARVNYFSSIATNQTFNTNVYDASRNNRSYGVNVVGAWSSYSVNGTFDRNEYFNTTTSSGIVGNSPRVSFGRSERPLWKDAPIYFAMSGEGAHLDRQTKASNVFDDRSVGRFDFSPQIRYPFKQWPFFTVNSSINWRDTFYTRTLSPVNGTVVDDSLNRQFVTLTAQSSGPVLVRVWDTPNSGYAERWKHTIEPVFGVQRTSAIERRNEIIQIDGTDTPFGNTTSYSYGINNRLYAKRKVGTISQAQEVLGVEIVQSYYTDARASQVDPRFATSFAANQANNFSPIAISVRGTPTQDLNATFRAEIDSRYKELRTISVSGTHSWGARIQSTGGWSRRFFIKELPGFNSPQSLDHYLSLATNAHTIDNHFGAIYSVNYDLLRSTLLQQRISGFYNAQCCGIAFEYQKYNLAQSSVGILPSDQRFFLSVTLAGLGSFSPFSGGLGGVPR